MTAVRSGFRARGPLRFVVPEVLDQVALAAPVLACGGGSDPHLGKLVALAEITAHGSVPLLPLGELPDEALVIGSGCIGAPTVCVEKIPSVEAAVAAFNALEEVLGQKAFAAYSIGPGGMNSLLPIATSARLRIPLLDARAMARSYPEIPQAYPGVLGFPATPAALADEQGNLLVLRTSASNDWTERLARTMAVQMGHVASIALYPLRGRDARRALIPDSVGFLVRIGRALQEARRVKEDPVAALLGVTGGSVIFEGVITDIVRRTVDGFARGSVQVAGEGDYGGSELTIRFCNENLGAERDGRLVITVPDLVVVLDRERGVPLTTEGLRFGNRTSVVAIPGHPGFRSATGLGSVRPQKVGLPRILRPSVQDHPRLSKDVVRRPSR